jgi:hypothetical protein
MTNEYREAPPPTRAEFAALEERLTALEKRKPKEPFALTLLHTFVAGLTGLVACIYAFGWMYDHLHDNGTRISLNIICGLTGLVALITAICSLAALEDRRGLTSPWRAK